MSRQRESGFGGYIVLTLFSGIVVLLVAFFLAVFTGIVLGFLNITLGEVLNFEKIFSEVGGYFVILLAFFYWIVGMAISYRLMWSGRTFR